MNNYKAEVNRIYTFDINEKSLDRLDIIRVGNSKFHVIKDSLSYKAAIIHSDFLSKKYIVKINGNSYQINFSDSLDSLIKQMGFEIEQTKQINVIKAPMPGLVLEINVKIGQEVKEGDTLLILEAMKMENIFTSPRAGIIKSIMIKNGQAVDKGQLLISFE